MYRNISIFAYQFSLNKFLNLIHLINLTEFIHLTSIYLKLTMYQPVFEHGVLQCTKPRGIHILMVVERQ